MGFEIGPNIGVFLRNYYKNVNTSILLHDIPNTELTLRTSILVDPIPEIPAGIIPYKKSIRFECHANVPVKWEYIGDGVCIFLIP
jgi:hypothetical protein